jgi:hypothetical protein
MDENFDPQFDTQKDNEISPTQDLYFNPATGIIGYGRVFDFLKL